MADKLLKEIHRLRPDAKVQPRVGETIVKKTTRPDHPRETSRRSGRGCSTQGGWSFNLANENLITLGTSEGVRRVAYRTATGELRFLPT